ncbi:MAG TPA: hypothetical protein PLW44_02475, partial [Chitinophagales bacterium]|nr:hypothetical protein [Chitinophagales bacterium]
MKKLYAFIVFLCLSAISFAQIINDYAAVTNFNPCSNALTVSNVTGFAAGSRILIIQMKGVDIDQSNSTAF